MNRSLAAWLIALLGSLVCFVWTVHAKPALPKVIKVGVMAPLTGKGAMRGQSSRQGLELALEKIRRSQKLAGSKIDLLYQDVPFDQSKRAPAVLIHLIDVKNVHAVIGPMGSTVSLSVTPLVDRRKVPVLIHTASALEITTGNKYVFRLWPTARNYAAVIFEELTRRKYNRVAAISSQQDNTLDLLTLFKKRLVEANNPLVFDETVSPFETDFRSLLLKVAAAKPDAVFLNLFEGQIGLAARQVRELGMQMPLFTNAVMSAAEFNAGHQPLEGIWFPRFGGYSKSGKEEFLKRFGAEPANPESAAAAHDALLVMAEAFSAVGTDPKLIRNYIANTTFKGITGSFDFDKQGDARIELGIRVVKDGQIVPLL